MENYILELKTDRPIVSADHLSFSPGRHLPGRSFPDASARQERQLFSTAQVFNSGLCELGLKNVLDRRFRQDRCGDRFVHSSLQMLLKPDIIFPLD